eukprot:scaffold129_cov66-Phaeocystis_antarctica.AAC.2
MPSAMPRVTTSASRSGCSASTLLNIASRRRVVGSVDCWLGGSVPGSGNAVGVASSWSSPQSTEKAAPRSGSLLVSTKPSCSIASSDAKSSAVALLLVRALNFAQRTRTSASCRMVGGVLRTRRRIFSMFQTSTAPLRTLTPLNIESW